MKKENKIKLVQVIADSDLSGGPKHVLGILTNIDQDKFDLFLICPKGHLAEQTRKIKGVKVTTVEMGSKYDIGAVYDIKSLLEKIRTTSNPFGPMIVHTHGPRAGLLGRHAMPRGVISIYTEHRWDADYHLDNRLNEWLQKRALKSLNYKTDLVIAVSGSVKKYLIEKRLVPESRVKLIPNGIDLEDRSQISDSRNPKNLKLKQLESSIIIGSIGNLNKQKGYEYLIQAMPKILKIYPHLMLEIVGDGAERGALRSLKKELGVERYVTLLGRKENPEEVMKKWNLFVSSSIAETFGIVFLEAYKVGLPLVVTKVGGVPDVVTNNKTGLLVPARDPGALADAVIKLLKHPALAAKLKRGGQAKLKEFDWKKVIKMIEKEYLRLVSAQ